MIDQLKLLLKSVRVYFQHWELIGSKEAKHELSLLMLRLLSQKEGGGRRQTISINPL